MGKTVKFYLEQAGAQEVIYHSSELKNLEQDAMERVLSEVRAQFIIDFGLEGNFILEYHDAPVKSPYVSGTRPTYRVKAGDARTQAILNRNPKWLERFSVRV